MWVLYRAVVSITRLKNNYQLNYFFTDLNRNNIKNNIRKIMKDSKQFIKTSLREFTNEKLVKSEKITELVNYLSKKYAEEYGVSCDMINQGNCQSFSDELYTMAKEHGIEGVILSDELFFDPFDDGTMDMMQDISEYGIKPNDFDLIGLPSHYWFYYNGKHYDSDVPHGVDDVFHLPTIKNFYSKNRG
jgi:hypothetical protein